MSLPGLEKLLLREQSRANTDMITGIIMSDPRLFNELWEIMMLNQDPLSRRAAWVVDYCAESEPGFLNERIELLAASVVDFRSDGLKRHGLRMLSRSGLPVENLGPLTNACFKWLQSPNESVAVKMYSMLILHRVTAIFPELARELYDIIEIQLHEATPGFINCGRKIMKKLTKTGF
ncbi:hypothetical protein [Lentimicrobium sp.]|uniref:hypothetical protein n=1 Tax=Lentimicrobium sp. TaxID=2034841 RepID=UPI00345EF64C